MVIYKLVSVLLFTVLCESKYIYLKYIVVDKLKSVML